MRKSTIAVVGALTLAVVAVPTMASASNGHAWLLGRSNYESAATTVTNSAGTPLSLKAKAGYAPLRVNSSKTVTNLSADRLDGLSSGSFLRSTAAAGFARTTGKTGIINDPDTSDQFGPKCPAGTTATGGGGITPFSAIQYNGPDFNASDDGRLVFIPNSWVVIDAEGYVEPSFVTCYNPKGAVPGAASSMPNPYAGLSSMAAGGTSAPRHSAGNLKASAGK